MKQKNDLVSVIVNCYNGEKFLKDCINSILNQTHHNLEIIFFDNNSSDKSEKIIKGYKDKRIKYYKSKKYLKLYNARNLAIEKANGKFIAFLDTDDWWDEKKLEKQLDVFSQNKEISFIYTNFFVYNQNTNKKIQIYKKLLPSGSITQVSLNKYEIGLLTVMIKRHVFNIKKFNEDYEIIGDFDFFISISQKYKISSIEEPLAYYRVHSSNFSLKKINLHIEELERWIKLHEKDFLKKGYSLKKQKIVLIKLKIKHFFKKIINFD